MTETYRPPNWRDAQCCGTCKHWRVTEEWNPYLVEYNCREYPLDRNKRRSGGGDSDYAPTVWRVCDKWEKKE